MKNAVEYALSIAIMSVVGVIEGAEVAWNKVTFSGSVIEWKSSDSRYWLYVGVTYSVEGGCWTISPTVSIPEFTGIVYAAECGDIVTSATAVASDPVFATNRPWIPDTRHWSPIFGANDASVYLAIVLYDDTRFDDYESNPIYGWLEFNAGSDTLSLLGSAISLDGSPLVVGAIPEPGGGVLLLLGLSLLALRRR